MSKIDDQVLEIAEHNESVKSLVDHYLSDHTLHKNELYVRIIKALDGVIRHQQKQLNKSD